MRARVLVFLMMTAAVLPGTAMAQSADEAQTSDEDRGWLTSMIEDNLSDAGREVRLTGFAGALSSRATFTELSIADSDGVWLTIRNGAMQWNRAALLRGRIEIRELTAAEIDLPRGPAPAPGPDLPAPEASGFALPELPVSVQIDTVRAEKVVIGEPVFGIPVAIALDGSARLAGGEGEAKLDLRRVDGAEGTIAFSGSYSNATTQALIDLLVNEGKDGIAAQLIGLPDTPAVTLAVHGEGPSDKFSADIALSTDSVPRLSGNVTLLAELPEGAPAGSQPVRRFSARLGGDITSLFLPQYRDFFGPDVKLEADGSRQPDGALSLSDFALTARALNLWGQLEIGADGVPSLADLSVNFGLPDDGPVLLPGSGTETRFGTGALYLTFDAAKSEDWTLEGRIDQILRPDLSIETLTLNGTGRIAGTGPTATASGDFEFAASGVAGDDAALAEAVGPEVTGHAAFGWQAQDGVLNLTGVRVAGVDYGLDAAAVIAGLDTAFTVDGKARARIDRADRFAAIAGRPLAGALTAEITGSAGVLSGIFDARAEIAGTDLAIGQSEADRLLAGSSRIVAEVKRDTTGTYLKEFTLRAGTLSADAAGTLQTGGSDITATLDFSNLSVLGGPYRGALSAKAHLTQSGPVNRLDFSGNGTDLAIGQPEADRLLAGRTVLSFVGEEDDGAITIETARIDNPNLTLSADGVYKPGAADVTAALDFPALAVMGNGWAGALRANARLTETGSLRSVTLDGTGRGLAIGQAEADRVLAGNTTLSLAVDQEAGAIRIQRFDLTNPQLTVKAQGLVDDSGRHVDLDARLSDMQLVVPGFPGPLTVRGRAAEVAEGYRVDMQGQGPGETRVAVKGTVAADGKRANLSITGGAQAGLANAFIEPQSINGPLRFDLRLNGPARPSSLSGTVTLNNARFSDPTLGVALQDVTTEARLSDGRANLNASARVVAGGRISVSGPVELTAPYRADLGIRLDRARLRNPELYDTRLNGDIRVNGPLTGGARIKGAIDLENTELRVPSTGFGGAAPIPDMKHVAEPAAVRATRARAGLLQTSAAGDKAQAPRRPYELDLTISAPTQIFVRGRGLDAELGGRVRLLGTTDNVAPEGRFELIRGRLDILGKRFQLAEGIISLEGSLEPYIRFVASSENDGETSSIVIEGQASSPEIHFTSSSGLPEEEVLSRLLFGQGLDSISPLQAAQLASAVATLAGKGGEGIIGKLRSGFGLDDFDVSTDDEGNATLRAGKYISEKIYTDVEVGADGTSTISINLDVKKNVTLKGSFDTDGNSGVGVFFQRDY